MELDAEAGRSRQAELTLGSRVDVHTRYEFGRWVPGFTIAEIRPDGYRIERASDGCVLGAVFGADELRAVVTPPMASRTSAAPNRPSPCNGHGSRTRSAMGAIR
jgi:hypothetical protein